MKPTSLNVRIETNNAAFFAYDHEEEDPACPENKEARRAEVARILGHVVKQVGEGFTAGRLTDYNGNLVGAWELDD